MQIKNCDTRRNVVSLDVPYQDDARKVKILERAEIMGDGPTHSERPWEEVTHHFWTA
jgi:hypothetical protein